MSRVATVIPEDGLNLRERPDTGSRTLGLLAVGQQVTITARTGVWRRLETSLGAGFAHGDFLTVENGVTVNAEPAGLDIEIPASDLKEPDDRTGNPEPVQFYVVQSGDFLSTIGEKLGIPFLEIAAANGIEAPFPIFPNQVLRLPGASLKLDRTARFIVRNPLPSQTIVTSSSAQGHHRPYGGTHSVDLDITGGFTPGTPARFNIEVEGGGGDVRGIVNLIGHACRSGLVNDGGRKCQLKLQFRPTGGDWADTGGWILYAHLDPVTVTVDDIVNPGDQVGLLGAQGGFEYNSSCAEGSHVHVELTRGEWVIDLGEKGVDRAIFAMSI